MNNRRLLVVALCLVALTNLNSKRLDTSKEESSRSDRKSGTSHYPTYPNGSAGSVGEQRRDSAGSRGEAGPSAPAEAPGHSGPSRSPGQSGSPVPSSSEQTAIADLPAQVLSSPIIE